MPATDELYQEAMLILILIVVSKPWNFPDNILDKIRTYQCFASEIVFICSFLLLRIIYSTVPYLFIMQSIILPIFL